VVSGAGSLHVSAFEFIKVFYAKVDENVRYSHSNRVL